MPLERSPRASLAYALGLVDSDGNPSRRGIAASLRSVLARWGLSSRRSILRYVRQQIDAAGLRERISADDVSSVLRDLTLRGEIEEMFVGHERFLAPGRPRWVKTGANTGVYLGVVPLPKSRIDEDTTAYQDTVQRLTNLSDVAYAAMAIASVEEISIEEWLQPLQYRSLARRRLERPIRDDEMSLVGFWELLCSTASREGRLIFDDTDVRYLTGPPGGFFGQYAVPDLEGRWAANADDGHWCAYRKGYGETHWHPCVVKVEGTDRRCLDLYDHDEWNWALIAKGKASGAEERIGRVDEEFKVTFPLPSQLSSLLDLLGPRLGTWRWRVNSDVPDPFSLLT
jgi:hypothetical protein